MVAVVSGAGLGLSNTSKELAGAAGQLGQSAFGRAGESVSVNAATGNLIIQNRDEFVVGVGDDFNLIRTYNSLGGWDGDNGDGWRVGYYRRVSGLTGTVNTAGSTIKRIDADGFESTYTYSGGRYVGKDGSGAFDSLTFASGKWTWKDGNSGTTETYEESPAGSGAYRLMSVRDVEGNQTMLGYDGTGLLMMMMELPAGSQSMSSALSFSYDSTTKRLMAIAAMAQDASGEASRMRTVYGYDSNGRLSSVTTILNPEDMDAFDGRSYRVDYGYDASGRVTSIKQTDGTVLTIAYDASGRVSRYADALGNGSTFTYDTAARTTTIVDANNQSTVLKYDAAQRLTEVSGAAAGGNGYKQVLAYDADGNLTSVTNPANEQTVSAYDTNGNLVRTTDAAGNVVEFAYDAANHLVAQTSYTVADPDGAAGPALPGGALKTQYLYESTSTNRLRFTISPEGRVTEHRYNTKGQRTSSTTYTTATYTAKPSPVLADLTTWAGALTVTDRAEAQQREYTYDVLGQLSSSKTYATASVNGSTVTYGTVSEQRYVYDAFGRLLQSIDATGGTTAYAYDGMDRVTFVQDARGRVTTYNYDDAGGRIVVRNPADNSDEISVYDKAGQLVAKSSGTSLLPVSSRQFIQAGSADWSGYQVPGTGLTFSSSTGAVLSTGNAAATEIRSITGSRVYRFDSGMVFSAKVSMPALAVGQSFTVGAGNATGARYHRALVRDGQLFVQFFENGEAKELQLSTAGKPLQAGVTYQVDVETGDFGSVLYVHTGDRSTGFVHRASATDWGTARAEITAQDAPGLAVQQLQIQSLSELRHGGDGSVLLDQDFRLSPLGFSGWPEEEGLFSAGLNGVEVHSQVAGLSNAEHTVTGDAIHPVTSGFGVVSRFEITTGVAAAGRNLRVGVASTGTGTAARALSARFIDGDLYAEYRDAATGNWVRVKLSSAGKMVADGQAYVVEVRALATGGAQLSVYRQGTSAADPSAFSYQIAQPVWPDQRGFITAFGDAASPSTITTINRVQEVQVVGAPAAALRSNFAYDKLGRLRAVVDGNGQRSHVLYDAAGRKVADIDAVGRFTEYVYDAAGRLVQSVTYATLVGSTQLASLTDTAGNPVDVALSSVRPAPKAADDRIVTRYYDKAGRLQGTQDGLGYLTENVYDGAGRVLSTIAYSKTSAVVRIDTSTSNLTATPPAMTRPTSDAVNDRTSRLFYSADGLLQGTLDADGYLVTYEYDAAGRKISETRYAEATEAAKRTGDLSAMLPTKRPGDRRSFLFYDNAGLISGGIDADGYLTTYGYDAAGRVTTTTRYLSTARLLVTAGANNTGIHLARAGLTLASVMPTLTTNVVTTRTYNAAGELVREATPDGAVSRFEYDSNGRLVASYRGLEASPRVTRAEYDGAGQLTAEIDGLGNRTVHAYDTAGRRISTTDARGSKTFFYYDASGLLRYSILQTALGGEVTARTYNELGQLLKQPIAYANRLSVADTAALTGGSSTPR